MEILIPIALFAMIAAIVIAPRYFKSMERQKMAETLRAAIDKGQPIPLEMIEAMSSDVKAPPSPKRDRRVGIIWIGIAIGFAVMGALIGATEPDVFYPMLGVAAFPGFIGAAFIVMSLLDKPKP